MKLVNFSLSGPLAGRLKVLHKLGVLLFLLGVLLLVNGFAFEWILSDFSSRLVGFFCLFSGGVLCTYQDRKQLRGITAYYRGSNRQQRMGLLLSFFGGSILCAAWLGILFRPVHLALGLSLGLMAGGILVYTYGSYAKAPAGVKNHFVFTNSLTARGVLAWALSIVLTVFYIQLYWFSSSLSGMIRLFDPLSTVFRGKPADQWFLYGTLYTFVILFLGIKFSLKYRHNRYQLVRTLAVVFSQLVFAYFIPQILESFSWDSAVDGAGKYLGYYSANPVNVWPLNYSFFEEHTLNAYSQAAYQPIGMLYFVWGVVLFLVVTPFLTYLVGKRWYCSWICGCGGLAETAGDSFRHLSSKSTAAWKLERWLIHSIMVFVLVMTVAALLPYFTGREFAIGFLTANKNSFFGIASAILLLASCLLFLGYRQYKNRILLAASILFVFILLCLTFAFFSGNESVFAVKSTSIKKAYGFFIGSVFSGVIGVGFYPVLGNRIWCRFGCPMAGYMGLFQRFKSRFRITTNGGQCISCGNCSTYCEQGIDVRAYAQKGQNIVRASCVGCGICSAVCPRGVLKLENGPEKGRISQEGPIQWTEKGFESIDPGFRGKP
jgi:polyferredoxin